MFKYLNVKQVAAIAIPFAAVAIDRFLKWYASAALPSQGVALFPGVQYQLFTNHGLVFSLSENRVALIVSVAALVALAYLTIKAIRNRETIKDSAWITGALLIALGGLSNVYDRFAHGGVIDYLIFFSRSAWNCADIMILAGVLILFLKQRAKGDEQNPLG